jgi:hypothetical protein
MGISASANSVTRSAHERSAWARAASRSADNRRRGVIADCETLPEVPIFTAPSVRAAMAISSTMVAARLRVLEHVSQTNGEVEAK